jgi:ZIP family zinc transporter
VAAFFGGIFLIGLIDNLIPSAENPHEPHSAAELDAFQQACGMPDCDEDPVPGGEADQPGAEFVHDHKLMRMGLFTALAVGIHNFPEGLATFLAALVDPGLGAAIAIAIALHNIPEGISVSIPVYYATGSRLKAFIYSTLSGVSEVVGALIGYAAIMFFLGGDSAGVIPPQIMGILFAGVAGIMVYISLDELLPTSRAYGKGHDSLFGVMAGMGVMALSLLLMM